MTCSRELTSWPFSSAFIFKFAMNPIALTILTATLVGLAASQSLVLVGGGLTDGNAEIWNKVVTLAVQRILILQQSIKCTVFYISYFLLLREEKV